MTDPNNTPRLALPMIQPGQAQKELTHNEALAILDLIVAGRLVAIGLDTPPAAPEPGACWIVGDAPNGAWTGQAGAVAGWTAGGWRFIDAPDGTSLWLAGEGVEVRRVNGAWIVGVVAAARLTVGGQQVVGARQPAIASPGSGNTVDAGARAAIEAILGALQAHGLIAR